MTATILLWDCAPTLRRRACPMHGPGWQYKAVRLSSPLHSQSPWARVSPFTRSGGGTREPGLRAGASELSAWRLWRGTLRAAGKGQTPPDPPTRKSVFGTDAKTSDLVPTCVSPLRLPLWSMERDYHICKSVYQTFLRHLFEDEVIAPISLPGL